MTSATTASFGSPVHSRRWWLAPGAMLGVVLLFTQHAGASTQPKGISVNEKTAQTVPVPRIVNINGIATLEANGKPLLVVGAQCDIWRSTKQDEESIRFFKSYREMNATTVMVGIPWSKIEREKDHYNFEFLDWFIRQAEAADLKLVIALMNTNVCGKVQEGHGSEIYPSYTPSYILDKPGQYQRMVLPCPYHYVKAGPPMCPNDSRTQERERLLVEAVARHLRERDSKRTVVMVQLNNEFYYQQWDGPRPELESEEERAIRCQCPHCLAKWASHPYSSGEQFMFESFADHVRVLSEAITKIYPIPLYVNSPWWPPRVIPIFLSRAPKLAFVGIDGILTPREPNWLSTGAVDRNVPFAAENPTENSEVRLNLDVLPYYTAVGRPGIGNLLWECGKPFTVVHDPVATQRYREALYPIKNAQTPIAKARGTDRILAWYALRDIRDDVTTDIFGNFVPAKAHTSPVEKDRWFVREGTSTRIVDSGTFEAKLGGLIVQVAGTQAGVLLQQGKGELILALPSGKISIGTAGTVRAENGRFEGDTWHAIAEVPIERKGECVVVNVTQPSVIRILLAVGQ